MIWLKWHQTTTKHKSMECVNNTWNIMYLCKFTLVIIDLDIDLKYHAIVNTTDI